LVMAPWLDCDGLVKGLALAGPWGWESCESHDLFCFFGFVSDGHCCVGCLGGSVGSLLYLDTLEAHVRIPLPF